MSDPRKRFICKARKHIVSDDQRPYGRESECLFCVIDEIKGKREDDAVGFYEPFTSNKTT